MRIKRGLFFKHVCKSSKSSCGPPQKHQIYHLITELIHRDEPSQIPEHAEEAFRDVEIPFIKFSEQALHLVRTCSSISVAEYWLKKIKKNT